MQASVVSPRMSSQAVPPVEKFNFPSHVSFLTRTCFCRPIDEDLAEEIRQYRSPSDGETRMFYEIVIAPSYTEAGLTKLQGKSRTLRILEAKARAPSGRSLRQIAGQPQLGFCMSLKLQRFDIVDAVLKGSVTCNYVSLDTLCWTMFLGNTYAGLMQALDLMQEVTAAQLIPFYNRVPAYVFLISAVKGPHLMSLNLRRMD